MHADALAPVIAQVINRQDADWSHDSIANMACHLVAIVEVITLAPSYPCLVNAIHFNVGTSFKDRVPGW